MTYRYRIALLFLAGFFIDCINIFMSAIALPDIARQMHLSASTVAWVANSYILGLALAIPLSNWIASLISVRLTFTLSMLLFSFGALFSGMSHDFGWLVLWRFLQGAGGGLLIPPGQALTFSLFQKQERAKVSTLIMVVALIAPAISPTVGGAIVDHISWRWVFWCNIPFSLLTAILALLWIKREKTVTPRPDGVGLVLVTLALTALLSGLSLFAQETHWPLPCGLLALSMLLALRYLRHQRRHADAILDLTLLRNPRLGFSVLIYYAVPGVFTGVNLLNIFYLQQVLNWGARETGMLMMLYAAGSLVSIVAGGRFYNRTGAGRLFLAALLCHALGIALLSWVETTADLPWLIVAYLLMGTGGGLAASCAQTTAMIDFEGAPLARASTLWNLNRQICFSIGAALFTLIFNLLLQHTSATLAYHHTFLIAALLGLLPLLRLHTLNHQPEDLCPAKKR